MLRRHQSYFTSSGALMDKDKDCCSSYRGCAITARSTEVPAPSDWVELSSLPSTWSGRFMASFSVDTDDARIESWQQFPIARFETRTRAVANAVTEAHRSIDMRLNRL